MKNIFLAILTGLLITGCGPVQDPLPADFRTIKILEINPPKHFVLTYQILDTGQIVNTKSKHCNDWRAVRVGAAYIANVNETGCGVIRSIRGVQ